MAALSGLHALGRAVARSENAIVPPESEQAALRARIMRAAFAPRRSALLAVGVAAIVLAVGATALTLAMLRSRTAPDVGFVAGGAVGRVGEYLVADGAQPLSLRFTEGSEARLAPGSRGRVTGVSPFGADVVIEAGRVEMAVVPRPGNRWSVRTGPFVVRVTGTRFAVTWDAAKTTFALDLFEGTVVISGGVLGDGLAVFAGERLEAAYDRDEYRVSNLSRVSGEGSPTAAEVGSSGAAGKEAPSPVKPPPAWLLLARAARYADAYDAAEAAGFDGECAGARAEDLLLLGDVARLSGHPDAARGAYQALRLRFPGTPVAGDAAFYLGRLDWDRRRDPSSATRWLRVYLAERPSGPLAAAALGRLLEIEASRGDRNGERAIAEQYLRQFPKGPHAAAAARALHGGAR